MKMNFTQIAITIAMLALGSIITRGLPFLIFSEKKRPPLFIQYMGKALPLATFGMLLVYCLKDVSLFKGSHGMPEFIAILITAGLHQWRRQMPLSVAAGTVSYMLLVHFIF